MPKLTISNYVTINSKKVQHAVENMLEDIKEWKVHKIGEVLV